MGGAVTSGASRVPRPSHFYFPNNALALTAGDAPRERDNLCVN
jgi:hypothetical protein